jgi:ATP-dependent protease ClpP protease subunit
MNFKKSFGKAESDELIEPHGSYTEYTQSYSKIVVDIDEEVKSAKYYRHICNKIRELGETDEVEFNINSNGGDLHGLISLLDAINLTNANVTAYCKGSCDSAASLLALSCHDIVVSPYCTMLVHFAEMGIQPDRMYELRNQLDHYNELCKRVFVDVYQGFLTDAEIEDVINGKQMWLQSEEIIERLEKRKVYFEKIISDKKEK